MTTTHELAEAAQKLILDASELLLHEVARDIPAATAAASTDELARIVSERVLTQHGYDITAVLLDPPTPRQAYESLQAIASEGIDLEAIYGPNYAAILGILRAGVECSEGQVRTVAYQLRGFEDHMFGDVFVQADVLGVGGLLANVCSDIHFACDAGKRDMTAAGARILHLKGVRGFELAGAYYVLQGAGWNPTLAEQQALLNPVLKAFFPEGRLA